MRSLRSLALSIIGVMLAACATPAPTSSSLEEIYVLRSIREQHAAEPNWCAASKTGFEPYAEDAERYFSFWSVETRASDGRIVDAHRARVAELRGCFGPTEERPRQNFYAEIQLGAITAHGRGECLALMVDSPEPGLFPVRCQLVLSDLPAPYVGGLLTTNTITSAAPFGPDTEPPGYTQASIATIRLWRGPST